MIVYLFWILQNNYSPVILVPFSKVNSYESSVVTILSVLIDSFCGFVELFVCDHEKIVTGVTCLFSSLSKWKTSLSTTRGWDGTYKDSCSYFTVFWRWYIFYPKNKSHQMKMNCKMLSRQGWNVNQRGHREENLSQLLLL